MIWSFLKSVGFSQTVTPFDKVSTVTPISRISRRAVTVPGVGLDAISALPFDSSCHAVSVAAAPERSASRTDASAGGVTPFLSGATAITTRFVSVTSSRASAAVSVVVMVGTNRLANSNSVAIPDVGTSLRNSDTISEAKPGLSDLSRSLKARS